MKCRKCGYENDFLKRCPFHQPQSEIDAICKERDKKEAESKGAKNTEQQVQLEQIVFWSDRGREEMCRNRLGELDRLIAEAKGDWIDGPEMLPCQLY